MLVGIGQLGTLSKSDIQQMIISSAQKHGVDPALALAVAKVESSYNTTAVSSAGAIGVMQLMPATAASLGVNPNDPAQNIDGGVKLLSQLLSQYNGDTNKALWAYNAGPGSVATGRMPAQTQSYIPAVLSSEQLFSDYSSADTSTVPPDFPTPQSPSWFDSTVNLAGYEVSLPVVLLVTGAALLGLWAAFR